MRRTPTEIHPLFEHTPTNHLIQVVDAPIRTAEGPAKTVKILVCNTQHPGNLIFSEEPEKKQPPIKRFKQLSEIIKKISLNNNSPDIYTFSEVHPEMLKLIEKHFHTNKYHIAIKKGISFLGNERALVTVLHKSVVSNVKPFDYTQLLDGSEVQSLLCTTYCEGGKPFDFILHVADLDNSMQDISTVENKIVNHIFSLEEYCQYPQILTNNLNITLQEQDTFTQKNIATSAVPETINDQLTYRWDKTLGTLTCPSIKDRPPSTKWLDVIEVEDHSLIDPTNGQIISDQRRFPINNNIVEIRLLSQFGDVYASFLSRFFAEEAFQKSPGIAAFFVHSPSLKRRLEMEKRRNKAVTNIITSTSLNTEKYYIEVRLASDQWNQGHKVVFNVSKPLWTKLKAFLELNQTNINAEENERSTFLTCHADNDQKRFLNAVINLTKDPCASLFSLEGRVKGCYFELIKENNVFYVQFSFKHRGQLVAQSLKHLFPRNSKIVVNDQFKLPIGKIPKNIANQLGFLIEVAKLTEKFNNNCYGLITLTFLPEQVAGTGSFQVKFFNHTISKTYTDIHSDLILNNIRAPYLPDGCFSIEIPYKIFLEKIKSKLNLQEILSKNVKMILNLIPYGIQPSKTDKKTVVSKSPLPDTLIKDFNLTRKKSSEGLFFYTLPSTINYANITISLYKDVNELINNICTELQSYKGKNSTHLALKGIAGNSTDTSFDPEGHCIKNIKLHERISEHCNKTIQSSQKTSKSRFLWKTPKSDKHTDLLHKSLIQANFLANIEFNYPAEGKIKTLQQLINTQEKRELYERCVKERKRDGGEPYNKIQRNSALLLLEQHLILSHPAYTAKEVWEYIKGNPVKNYGSGTHYLPESGDGVLPLGEILKPIKEIRKFLSSLITSNDVKIEKQKALIT